MYKSDVNNIWLGQSQVELREKLVDRKKKHFSESPVNSQGPIVVPLTNEAQIPVA